MEETPGQHQQGLERRRPTRMTTGGSPKVEVLRGGEATGSMARLVAHYLSTEVCGVQSGNTLRAKGQDLAAFASWFCHVNGHGDVTDWMARDTQTYLAGLQTAGKSLPPSTEYSRPFGTLPDGFMPSREASSSDTECLHEESRSCISRRPPARSSPALTCTGFSRPPMASSIPPPMGSNGPDEQGLFLLFSTTPDSESLSYSLLAWNSMTDATSSQSNARDEGGQTKSILHTGLPSLVMTTSRLSAAGTLDAL